MSDFILNRKIKLSILLFTLSTTDCCYFSDCKHHGAYKKGIYECFRSTIFNKLHKSISIIDYVS